MRMRSLCGIVVLLVLTIIIPAQQSTLADALYSGDSMNCNGDVLYGGTYSLSCEYIGNNSLGQELYWTGGKGYLCEFSVGGGWDSGADSAESCGYGSHTDQSGFVGTDGFAQMQSDGNFVLYTGSDVARWATNTDGYGSSAFLNLQSDGNLVVYYDTNVPIWSLF